VFEVVWGGGVKKVTAFSYVEILQKIQKNAFELWNPLMMGL
jgi:hypothetical protein